MLKQVNEEARRRLRARFREGLARYRPTDIEDVEHAVELWDSAVLSTLSDVDLGTLASVFSALRRVADGTYGRCATCGGAIASARLEAFPEEAQCIDCARAPAWHAPRS